MFNYNACSNQAIVDPGHVTYIHILTDYLFYTAVLHVSTL